MILAPKFEQGLPLLPQHLALAESGVARVRSLRTIEPVPVAGLTHVLLGALTNASLEVGQASEPAVAREIYGDVMDFMLDKLKK